MVYPNNPCSFKKVFKKVLQWQWMAVCCCISISKNITNWTLSTQTSHIHRRLKHQKSVTLFTNLKFTFLFHVHKIWHDIKLLKWFNCVVENVISFISANRYFFWLFYTCKQLILHCSESTQTQMWLKRYLEIVKFELS